MGGQHFNRRIHSCTAQALSQIAWPKRITSFPNSYWPWAKFGPGRWPKLGKSKQAKENGIKHKCLIPFHFLVPAIGFELMTYRLQGGCSTN
jgi:hypothetical protein